MFCCSSEPEVKTPTRKARRPVKGSRVASEDDGPKTKRGVGFTTEGGIIDMPGVSVDPVIPASFRRSMATPSMLRDGPSRPETATTMRTYSGVSGGAMTADHSVNSQWATTSHASSGPDSSSKSKWWKNGAGTWSKKLLTAMNLVPGHEVPPTPVQYTRPRPPRSQRYPGQTWWQRLKSWKAPTRSEMSAHTVDRLATSSIMSRTTDYEYEETISNATKSYGQTDVSSEVLRVTSTTDEMGPPDIRANIGNSEPFKISSKGRIKSAAVHGTGMGEGTLHSFSHDHIPGLANTSHGNLDIYRAKIQYVQQPQPARMAMQ